MEYIHRDIERRILETEKFFPVIVVTGPRQVGKTTLCRAMWPDFEYVNLEDVALKKLIAEDPKKFIANSADGLIIDEVQYIPELFSYIQLCVDENPGRKFILTGSSDFALMENITQSLSGRAALFNLLPFSFDELRNYVDEAHSDEIMFNGFYPGVIVKKILPKFFYSNYYSTYIERDVRKLKAIDNLDLFQTFVRVVAGRAAREMNASAISGEVGVSSPTAKSWLSILKTSYVVFTLQPFFTNIEKRLTKTPKIYFYDTGLLCYLLGINDLSQLATHPLRGEIFENLIVSELLKVRNNRDENCSLYFYRENKGREVDVVKTCGLDMHLYEIKSAKTFHSDFRKNLTYLKGLFGEKVKSERVVYDGDSYPPDVINFRRLE